MANPEHVERLVESTADQWNAWRDEHKYDTIDLSGDPVGSRRKDGGLLTEESRGDFRGFNFIGVDLTRTSFAESDLSGADLSGTIYNQVLLVGAKMHETNLSVSEFRDSFFHMSDMTSATLTNARFRNSFLKGTILSGAKLDETDFATSDLTAAVLTGCDLSTTKLSNATLTCTALHYSDVNVHSSMPQFAQNIVDDGLADLVEDVIDKLQTGQRKIADGEALDEKEIELVRRFVPVRLPGDGKLGNVSSVSDLFQVVGSKIELFRSQFGSRRFRVYYRGHGCWRRQMMSSLDRDDLRKFESELLRDLTMIEPDEFRDALSILDQLTLARHHSLPARLLDVTRDPLVALYFACHEIDPCANDEGHGSCTRDGKIHMLVTPTEMLKPYDSDAVSVVAAMSQLRPVEQDVLLTKCPDRRSLSDVLTYGPHATHHRPGYSDVMQRLVNFVARDKPYFRNSIDPRDFFRVFVVEPRVAFSRVRAQSGAFLVSGFHKEFEARMVEENGPEVPVYDHYMIDIPRDSKPDILKQLEYAQINEVTMLPGLEPVARSIGKRYGAPDEKPPVWPDSYRYTGGET